MEKMLLMLVGCSFLAACGPGPKSKQEQQQDELLAKLEAQKQQNAAVNSEQIATIINLSGNLCARVTNVSQLQVGNGQVYEVTCVEYRGGTGTVRYAIDMRNQTVQKIS